MKVQQRKNFKCKIRKMFFKEKSNKKNYLSICLMVKCILNDNDNHNLYKNKQKNAKTSINVFSIHIVTFIPHKTGSSCA